MLDVGRNESSLSECKAKLFHQQIKVSHYSWSLTSKVNYKVLLMLFECWNVIHCSDNIMWSTTINEFMFSVTDCSK